MPRHLVLANQTLGGEPLLEVLRDLAEEEDCELHVVVPATPPDQFQFHTEGEAIAVAQDRLDDALERFSQLGVDVSGEVGDGHPQYAVNDALRDGGYDSLIVSTFPAGISRWLGMDLISRLERSIELPITHIETEPEG